MNQAPNPNSQQHVAPPPQPRRPRLKFRWKLVWIVLTILVVAWFLKGVAPPPFDWQDVMEWLGVRTGGFRFTKLTVLMVSMVCLVAIVRILKADRSKR